MEDGRKRRGWRFDLWGWVLFLVCAVFFIASAVISGDMLYFTGSIIFLVACLLFIASLVRE